MASGPAVLTLCESSVARRRSDGVEPDATARRRTGTILTQSSYFAFRRAPRAIATSLRNQNKLSAQKTAEHIKNAVWTPPRSASHGAGSRFSNEEQRPRLKN